MFTLNSCFQCEWSERVRVPVLQFLRPAGLPRPLPAPTAPVLQAEHVVGAVQPVPARGGEGEPAEPPELPGGRGRRLSAAPDGIDTAAFRDLRGPGGRAEKRGRGALRRRMPSGEGGRAGRRGTVTLQLSGYPVSARSNIYLKLDLSTENKY